MTDALIPKLAGPKAVLHGVAPLAGEEDRTAAGAMIHAPAGKEGVLAFQPVDDAGFEQGINGAVDRDGRQPCTLLGQLGEDVVGADRSVGGGDLFENVLTKFGEPQVLFGKRLAGSIDGFRQFAFRLGQRRRILLLGGGLGHRLIPGVSVCVTVYHSRIAA